MDSALRMQTGGAGQPTLLLLHGLGATGDVWSGWRTLLAQRWPGRWIVPDLPGHGGSAPMTRYSFGALAAALSEALDPDDDVVIIGHSLGGVVGLALASGWFGVRVRTVVGLGIKVAWSEEELAKARALASRPASEFATRDEAIERHLRVSGLVGLLPPDDERLAAGVREEGGRWRLALDNAAFAVGEPDVPGLLVASRAVVVLARGEHDPMVSDEQLVALWPAAVQLAGVGHNAQVEHPAEVLALVEAAAG